MLIKVLLHLSLVTFAARSNEITVIGKERSEEVLSLDIIRTGFKAQAAFETSSDLVFKLMVFFRVLMIFAYERVHLLKVFLDDSSVDHQVADNRELVQGFDGYGIALQIPYKRITGKPRDLIDNHGTAAAHALQA